MMNPTLAGVALNTILGLRIIIFRAYRANVGHTSGRKKKGGRTRRKGIRTRSRVLTSPIYSDFGLSNVTTMAREKWTWGH